MHHRLHVESVLLARFLQRVALEDYGFVWLKTPPRPHFSGEDTEECSCDSCVRIRIAAGAKSSPLPLLAEMKKQ